MDQEQPRADEQPRTGQQPRTSDAGREFVPSGPVVSRARLWACVAVAGLVFAAAAAVMLAVWARVPAVVAWQWDVHGSPTTQGPAWTWWLVLLLGLAIGAGFPLLAGHQVDRLVRMPLGSLGAGVGVVLMGMTAQVVLAQAGADPARLPPMPNVLPSLALAVVAAVAVGLLLARAVPDASALGPAAQPEG